MMVWLTDRTDYDVPYDQHVTLCKRLKYCCL